MSNKDVKLHPIKSPLRYPGGKSRALKYLTTKTPQSFKEFREPFLGGGSMFIEMKQKHPEAKFWINDKYYVEKCECPTSLTDQGGQHSNSLYELPFVLLQLIYWRKIFAKGIFRSGKYGFTRNQFF